jgi:hypothetical protein
MHARACICVCLCVCVCVCVCVYIYICRIRVLQLYRGFFILLCCMGCWSYCILLYIVILLSFFGTCVNVYTIHFLNTLSLNFLGFSRNDVSCSLIWWRGHPTSVTLSVSRKVYHNHSSLFFFLFYSFFPQKSSMSLPLLIRLTCTIFSWSNLFQCLPLSRSWPRQTSKVMWLY